MSKQITRTEMDARLKKGIAVKHTSLTVDAPYVKRHLGKKDTVAFIVLLNKGTYLPGWTYVAEDSRTFAKEDEPFATEEIAAMVDGWASDEYPLLVEVWNE